MEIEEGVIISVEAIKDEADYTLLDLHSSSCDMKAEFNNC